MKEKELKEILEYLEQRVKRLEDNVIGIFKQMNSIYKQKLPKIKS